MSITITNQTGDGISVPMVSSMLVLPDFGHLILIVGQISTVGGEAGAVNFSGTLTAPNFNGGSPSYWIIQVNTSNGTLGLKGVTGGPMPSADPGYVAIFAQIDATGATSHVTNPGQSIDTW